MARFRFFVLAMFLGIAFLGCEREGPAEKTGKEIDKAAKEMGQAMENAADAVKEATKAK